VYHEHDTGYPMTVPNEVRTARLRLRRPVPADLDAVADLHTDPRTHQHEQTGPRTRDQSAALLEDWIAHWAAHGFGYWMIEPAAPSAADAPIGVGGLQHKHLPDAHYLNVYYRLAPTAWGHGYATEMVTAAISWARTALPDVPIMIITRPGNAAALRVADKTGFVKIKDDVYEDAPAAFLRHRPGQQVRIVHLTGPVFRALAGGDLTAANAASPVPLTPLFIDPASRGVWRMRTSQIERDPASAGWVNGVIWCERRQVTVGHAGYHGPPDPSGMVEIGYTVDPAYRRRGYARAALESLLQRAAREPQVRTARVSIRPDNVASYGLAAQYGFAKVGEQWDDEDGLEIVYEVDVPRSLP
jgi:RimJ/RimL family protein N-acetyltransferase